MSISKARHIIQKLYRNCFNNTSMVIPLVACCIYLELITLSPLPHLQISLSLLHNQAKFFIFTKYSEASCDFILDLEEMSEAINPFEYSPFFSLLLHIFPLYFLYLCYSLVNVEKPKYESNYQYLQKQYLQFQIVMY